MSQHDFNIANQTASATRLDLNNALGALASLSSGTAAPTTTFANMLWYETSTNWLWVRNESDTDWIRFAYFNQTTNKSALVNDTSVVNTSGTQVGLLGDQTTATWQSGTGTTQSLVSPANVKAAVQSLSPPITSASVGAATAGLAAGSVGSYGWFLNNNYSTVTNVTTTYTAGTLHEGSLLDWAGADRSPNVGWNFTESPAGTWRLMGTFGYRRDSDGDQVIGPRFSLYLRIS